MPDKGYPTIVFDGTTLTSASDCLQTAGLTRNGNPVTYICGNEQRSQPGVASTQLRFSFACAKDDVTKVAAFAANAEGACDYYPFGNVAGNIKRSTTKAVIATHVSNDAPNAISTVDITMNWDDLTDGTASGS